MATLDACVLDLLLVDAMSHVKGSARIVAPFDHYQRAVIAHNKADRSVDLRISGTAIHFAEHRAQI